MTHETVNASFDPYRRKEAFGAREPNLERMSNPDELTPIPPKERLLLGDADSQLVIASESGEALVEQLKYLWVVTPTEVVFALESGPAGKATSRKRLAHTNLTSGAAAHSGGELWFADKTRLVFSGASSRYRPRSAAEMEELRSSFESAGYKPFSLGWSEELNAPRRVWRGSLTWSS